LAKLACEPLDDLVHAIPSPGEQPCRRAGARALTTTAISLVFGWSNSNGD